MQKETGESNEDANSCEEEELKDGFGVCRG